MMRALYSSVSGLKTHQTKMDVLGNNIANVNTVGFKSSRTTFSTMMYQTTSYASGANAETGKGGVNAKQIGLGTNFASTAMDIDTGGASESTGRAFDLKLSDTNSTSFYIVNTGTENVFTRAGAFYVDGAGNLCMESTGYTVMGWQVDANGNIRKDTVSPLRIMEPGNQTSQPEYTTKAICSGILDDNNSNVNADTGYTMNLNFYDNLGYAYTAKFAAQKTGGKDDGQYTINLTNILDSNGKSIMTGEAVGLGELFGGGQGSYVDITDNYKVAEGMGNALGSIARTMTNQDGSITYSFTSDFVNEKLGPDKKIDKLKSGLTIKVDYKDGAVVADSLKVVDSNGAEVDVTDYQGTGKPVGQKGSFVISGNEITRTTYLIDELQEMVDAGQIPESTDTPTAPVAKIYLLDKNKVADFGLKYKDALGADPVPSASLRIEVGADGKIIPANLKWEGTTPTGSLEATAFGADTTTYSEKLSDLINQGYITVSAESINETGVFTTDLPKDAEVRYVPGDGGAWSYTIVTPGRDGYTLQFSTSDGSLTYIGSEGNTKQTLRMSNFRTEGNPFSDIEIDFSTLKNLSNGATCTAAMEAGADGTGEGKRVGTMIGLSVDQSGKIWGSYSNGDTALLGQIAVARFANASGLESMGNNCYKTTMNSGQFDGIGVEIDSDGSTIDSGVLEMSNVDLSQEFTQMITTQRGFQANSRVISTSDGILEELVNLKR